MEMLTVDFSHLFTREKCTFVTWIYIWRMTEHDMTVYSAWTYRFISYNMRRHGR